MQRIWHKVYKEVDYIVYVTHADRSSRSRKLYESRSILETPAWKTFEGRGKGGVYMKGARGREDARGRESTCPSHSWAHLFPFLSLRARVVHFGDIVSSRARLKETQERGAAKERPLPRAFSHSSLCSPLEVESLLTAILFLPFKRLFCRLHREEKG